MKSRRRVPTGDGAFVPCTKEREIRQREEIVGFATVPARAQIRPSPAFHDPHLRPIASLVYRIVGCPITHCAYYLLDGQRPIVGTYVSDPLVGGAFSHVLDSLLTHRFVLLSGDVRLSLSRNLGRFALGFEAWLGATAAGVSTPRRSREEAGDEDSNARRARRESASAASICFRGSSSGSPWQPQATPEPNMCEAVPARWPGVRVRGSRCAVGLKSVFPLERLICPHVLWGACCRRAESIGNME